MDSLGDHSMFRNMTSGGELATEWREASPEVGGKSTGYDEAYSTLCAFLPCVHGAHDYSVFQRDVAKVERRKKMGEKGEVQENKGGGSMKIFITGATGFVGTALIDAVVRLGHEVTGISSTAKTKNAQREGVRWLQADTSLPGAWQDEIAGHEVVINLAGRTIFHRWSAEYKKKIVSSRVHTTKNIVTALEGQSNSVLLSASAAGYYGDSQENEVDEKSPAGRDFLAQVCKDWEYEALCAREKGIRVACMRFGVVLGRGGGAVATMGIPFKLGLGGPLGNGRQWFPWIHVDDLVQAILFLMDNDSLSGPFNFCAPGHVRQREFARIFAAALGRPAFLPAPSFVVRTIAGELGASLLQGQKAIPKNLLSAGFSFAYPDLDEAIREIFS
ncbi:unnamed protein product [Cyprideis torosa]|uniref:Uncharacterized protein n=1 Tax=Cyprideis torosa TaxID=163714 RepID=A0A7R8WKB3_9CRUS|nr:unnamed protein product [Cyprideis torosa]CAG0895877.1 unnamed protein product [Cyprideis torosa]